MKNTKKMNSTEVILSFTALLLMITPHLNKWVNIHVRGYWAYGGECFIWVFPVLIYGLVKTMKGE